MTDQIVDKVLQHLGCLLHLGRRTFQADHILLLSELNVNLINIIANAQLSLAERLGHVTNSRNTCSPLDCLVTEF